MVASTTAPATICTASSAWPKNTQAPTAVTTVAPRMIVDATPTLTCFCAHVIRP